MDLSVQRNQNFGGSEDIYSLHLSMILWNLLANKEMIWQFITLIFGVYVDCHNNGKYCVFY